jgi:hypothetical protein
MQRNATRALFAGALILAAACTGGEGDDETTTGSSSSIATSSAANGGEGGSGVTTGIGGAGGGATGASSVSSSTGMPSDCAVDGIDGQCMDMAACDAMPGFVSTPGFCPGPANIQCCTDSPTTVDNPPIPSGYKFMMQAEVTPDMTTWAVAILHDPIDYPMFSTTTKTFGALDVLARVEWHPPDFLNMLVHRGVTLYEPI